MANNWQYATLSAGERLSRIRDGEYDIYTQEIARANEVIKNRKDIGLDISEQLAWIKKLDYVKSNNNGLGGALTAEEIDYNTKMGKTFTTTTQSNNAMANLQSVANFHNNANASNISNSSINSSNIGNIIGNNNTTSAQNIPNAPQLSAYTPAYSNADFDAELKAFMENQKKRRDELETTLQKELTEKYGILDSYYNQMNNAVEEDTIGKKSDYYANAVSRLPSMYEKFANSGLSFDGGKVRSEQMAYNNTLNKSLATLDAQAINAVNSNNLSKATERSKAYSDYTTRLSQENSRLDDTEYQMIRDMQDNAYKQNQFAWEQYKYSTQYEFDKYKYEQQLRETAEQKTLEQQRWEKEFQFKLSAQEFDQLLKNQQLTLETDKYLFDVDKYNNEYALKLQDYDLKLQQYYSDLGFKQQDYDLKNQEFKLKVDLAEFNKMLDNLKYTFDVDKFEKEYALKQSAQSFDAEKFYFDMEKFYKEYELKQQQYNQEYEYKTQQSQTQNSQWEREMALKEAVQKSNMTQAEKDYALKYLELEKKYTQQAASSSSSSSSSKTTSSSSSSTANTASSASSSQAQTSAANTNNTSSSSSSSTTTLYQTALTTAMWMKTQYVINGKNTIRKFSNNDIDSWINTLQLSAAEKAKLKRAIGVE